MRSTSACGQVRSGNRADGEADEGAYSKEDLQTLLPKVHDADKEQSGDNRMLQTRKVAGTEPAMGWIGQVRFRDDHILGEEHINCQTAATSAGASVMSFQIRMR